MNYFIRYFQNNILYLLAIVLVIINNLIMLRYESCKPAMIRLHLLSGILRRRSSLERFS